MPLRIVTGPKGKKCYQYGHRHKYCFGRKKGSKPAAKRKAVRQMRAMFAHGWKGHHPSKY